MIRLVELKTGLLIAAACSILPSLPVTPKR